ncbi:MAG: NAD(P)/FAD-dependent oxidoreductase, partial [Flavobacteriales bacterium]|nr:NAD(P)/FAD-dependent oxidoreductase [Flavobacteriales bacterium]
QDSFAVKGGMIQITRALYALAQELGVEFKFGSQLDSLVFQNKQIVGMETNLGFYKSDIVVSCIDINHIYDKLPKLSMVQKFNRKRDLSTSAVVFYWGLELVSKLDLHNIFFSENYKNEFAQLSSNLIPLDPTVYVNITKRVSHEDAPQGSENWFVMVNVPPGLSLTEKDIDLLRSRVVTKLNKTLSLNIDRCIREERITTPKTLSDVTGAFNGALYGQSCNHKYLSFLRQVNKSPLKGLYFAGGTVNPGGGIPLCLLSSKLVEELILEDYEN